MPTAGALNQQELEQLRKVREESKQAAAYKKSEPEAQSDKYNVFISFIDNKLAGVLSYAVLGAKVSGGGQYFIKGEFTEEEAHEIVQSAHSALGDYIVCRDFTEEASVENPYDIFFEACPEFITSDVWLHAMLRWLSYLLILGKLV